MFAMYIKNSEKKFCNYLQKFSLKVSAACHLFKKASTAFLYMQLQFFYMLYLHRCSLYSQCREYVLVHKNW